MSDRGSAARDGQRRDCLETRGRNAEETQRFKAADFTGLLVSPRDAKRQYWSGSVTA